MAVINVAELRGKTKEQLEEKLVEMKQELASLKVQKLTKGAVPQIAIARRNVARVLTIISLNQRQSAREFYAGKRFIPTDLREKKTRALRRALSAEDAARITEKTRKQRKAFPKKVYAIKA